MNHSLGNILDVLYKPEYLSDISYVNKELKEIRLLKDDIEQPDVDLMDRLNYLVESVISSIGQWNLSDEERRLCLSAAESAEWLSHVYSDKDEKRISRFRAALLYEIIGMSSASSEMIEENDFGNYVSNFFKKKNIGIENLSDSIKFADNDIVSSLISVWVEDTFDARKNLSENDYFNDQNELIELSRYVNIGLELGDIQLLDLVRRKRVSQSLYKSVDSKMLNSLSNFAPPEELFPAQVEALRGGLLDDEVTSWGFAAPTGSGKSFIVRLAILKQLQRSAGSKILYVVPSKALVNEVYKDLKDFLSHGEYKVFSMSSQLSPLSIEDEDILMEQDVIVITPEKADLLLRLKMEIFKNLSLVIVDEAHHIESGTRGILLEFYLWRIRKLLYNECKVIFLSAVTSNISDLTNWMSGDGKSKSVQYNSRNSKMKVAVYETFKDGRLKKDRLRYIDGSSIDLKLKPQSDSDQARLISLVAEMAVAGPVLVVCKGQSTAESLATKMENYLNDIGRLSLLDENQRNSPTIQRLDSRCERELYKEVKLRELVKSRIVYHHAGLPPRVRESVENAIRENLVDVVFATTSLGEGVNFPFSTVVVQALAIREAPQKGIRGAKYSPVTPRSFWNIAGRAGRPGYDAEGHIILFTPSLGIDKVNYVIDDYLNPNVKDLAPIRSALSEALTNLADEILSDNIKIEDISAVDISKISNKSQGAINNIRVGVMHIGASNIEIKSENILESLFAYRYLDDRVREIAGKIVVAQSMVVEDYFENNNGISRVSAAAIGVSLDTLSQFGSFVAALSDDDLRRFSRTIIAGNLNNREARFAIEAVCGRMTELEGRRLIELYSSIAMDWIQGKPIHLLRKLTSTPKIEDLVRIVYSKVQFLLPWGLYALDEFIHSESQKRGIIYSHEVRNLAYFCDSGVSNFNALRISNLGFERVDAMRLASALGRGIRGSDSNELINRIIKTETGRLTEIVQGPERRRLDYDFIPLINKLKQSIQM